MASQIAPCDAQTRVAMARKESGSRRQAREEPIHMTERPTTKAKRAVKTKAPPPAPEITWEDAVAEGKRLVAEGKQMIATADRNDWRLAELADQVGTQYGENSLAKFATEIGLANCTIKRRRTTYRNWKEILKSDPGLLLSYSVARELEKHPERERLIKDNPKMTKREAGALMRAYRSKPESETQRWWRDLILRVGKATADESVLNGDQQILLKVVQPQLLSTLREAGQAWINLADSLEKLFKKPRNKASFDTRRDVQLPALPDGPA
jgi:hypothetical protein